MSLRLKFACCALCTLLLAGCATTPDKQLEETAQSTLSTTASAQLLLSSWSEHEVPTPYAKSSLRTLQSDLKTQSQEIKDSGAPGQKQLMASLSLVRATLEKAKPLLQHDERENVKPLVDSLAAETAKLRTLQKQLKESGKPTP